MGHDRKHNTSVAIPPSIAKIFSSHAAPAIPKKNPVACTFELKSLTWRQKRHEKESKQSPSVPRSCRRSQISFYNCRMLLLHATAENLHTSELPRQQSANKSPLIDHPFSWLLGPHPRRRQIHNTRTHTSPAQDQFDAALSADGR